MDEPAHSRTLLPMKPRSMPPAASCHSNAPCDGGADEAARRTMPGGVPRESLGEAVLRELCAGAAAAGIAQRSRPTMRTLAPELRDIYCRIGEKLFGMGLDAARAEIDEAQTAREDALALVADLLAGSPEAFRRARSMLDRPTVPDEVRSSMDRPTTPSDEEIVVDLEGIAAV